MTTIQKKSLVVGKQVTTNHVDTVIRNYKKERWVHNSKRIGKEDSLSVWHSIEELEEFIAKAKDNGADGIKLYFGAYDTDYKENPKYAGRQTIVLVATKHKITDAGESNKDLYIQTDKGSTILAWNTGSLCPPYCGTRDKDDDVGIGITIVDKGDDGIIVA
jgi:pyridoxine 5'-phosphate synthase PdxJ